MQCSASLEFEPEFVEENVECPECKQQTELYEPEEDKEYRKRRRERIRAGKEKIAKLAAKEEAPSSNPLKVFDIKAFITIMAALAVFAVAEAIGLLLAILIAVIYYGFDRVCKEIRKLNR